MAASRCTQNSSRLLMPFLYPSLFRTSAGNLARASLALTRNRNLRYSSTDASTATLHPQHDENNTDETKSRLNPAPDDYSNPYFADKAKLNVYAGNGGNGCISFLRELFIPEGPANGGDGGHGGNVYIQAVHGETSLHKLARRRHIRAGKGKHGQGSAQGGQRGEDVIITVPVGTVVTEISRDDPEGERQLIDRAKYKRKRKKDFRNAPAVEAPKEGEEEGEDGIEGTKVEEEPPINPDLDRWLLYPGISSSDARRIGAELPRLPRRDRLFQQPPAPIYLDLNRPTPRPILLAAGGLGGLGNPHFANKDRPRPMFATKGEPAMSLEIELELKLLADVGLVGLPNAGKSTLLRALTNSRARVGHWAFTTLQPNIGTVVLDNNKGRPVVKSYKRITDGPIDDPFALTGMPDEVEQRTRFTVADIPGLIEGAHLDKGLGIAFLRHVERAGVLAFVIDLGAGNAVKALKALWNEVGLYAQMREDEEADRERAARIDWSPEAGIDDLGMSGGWPAASNHGMADYPPSAATPAGLSIAGKPWFVVATKGDLKDTQKNFMELRDYCAAVTRGDEPHPSGVPGAWIENVEAIPKGRGGGRGGKRSRDDNRATGGAHQPYTRYPEVVKKNDKLERYYNDLLQLPEEEREQFWAALKRELPNSFRFCGSKGHALAVKNLLQTRYIPEITRITYDGAVVDPPKAVPWYPDGLAWWMTTPKNVIRKFPPFSAFQKFLVSETSVGNISRQEVVSMIPPLLMDLRPGMTVLDMCAAPGSKAAQLLEMIHRGEEARIRHVIKQFGGSVDEIKSADEDAARLEADPSDDGRATGMLIANDADYKRSHMLIHQLKRLSSPNMIVTNHDATMYPSLRIPNPEDPTKPNYLKFDRILADVPCSGDGTLRKNVNLWKDWAPAAALGLHLTQVRILVRALQMLKPGGRMVYSTCSMNPVENESVVAAAIERCGGPDKIEIVDCADQLPLLQRKPGMHKWQIMDKSGRVWNSWQEVEDHTKSTEDGITPSRLVESMFPRPEGSICADLPLERCMRVYAHQQDTGGFFITVLQKKAEFKAKPEEIRPKEKKQAPKRPLEDAESTEEVKKQKTEADEAVKTEDVVVEDAPVEAEVKVEEAAPVEPEVKAEETPVESEVKTEETPVESEVKTEETPAETPAETPKEAQPERKQKQQGPYEEPFKYLPADHEVIKNIADFYKISSRFPSDRYMIRNATGEPAKAIYYTSALVRDILVMNEGRGVKFIHGGVKMYVKQDAPSAEVCRWRIQSEGMPILHGYVGSERVVVLRKKETLKKLLIEMFPKIADGGWEKLDEIGERVRDLALGCCVLRVEPDGTDPEFNEHMALPLWKSFQSLNLMLPKEDRSAMLLRIYNDTTPLINMGIKRDAPKEEKKEGEEVKAETTETSETPVETKVEEAPVEMQTDVSVPAPAEAEAAAEAAPAAEVKDAEGDVAMKEEATA
ncbi:mitochondrial GTPase 2-like protein [Sordaria brevicollis]|uniref:Mitochondrial GTPase 2-like protein n=1 Tax=Sordaria brevicollis TaxID=83679 RepID=A0AAE0UCR5_SORBR|nr:mitochondrial GTPase 2-like protein [Sordaria brevicollis]